MDESIPSQEITSPSNIAPEQNIEVPSAPPPFRTFSKLKLFLIVLVLLIITGSGTYAFLNFQKPKPQPTPKTQPTSTPSPTPTDETDSWKTYSNQKYGFKFKYPNNYSIKEEEESSTAFYVWLNNGKDDEFRLDVVPSNNSGSFASRLTPVKKFQHNNSSWTEYPRSSYSDAGMSGDTPTTYETKHNGFYFSLILFNENLTTAEKILSTFKFTN